MMKVERETMKKHGVALHFKQSIFSLAVTDDSLALLSGALATAGLKIS